LHSYHRFSFGGSAPSTRRNSFSAAEDEENGLLGHPGYSHEDPEGTRIVNVAIAVNFAANIVLLVAKIVVTLTSSSLSMLASLVDSILDFMSTAIIYIVSRIIQNQDWKSKYYFPVGRARLEPLGVLVFSVIMIVSFIQVGLEAMGRLFSFEETKEVVVLSTRSIVIMLSTGATCPCVD
jgi:divalent metal cation (Fe/Co/Zn/Cd) transporter